MRHAQNRAGPIGGTFKGVTRCFQWVKTWLYRVLCEGLMLMPLLSFLLVCHWTGGMTCQLGTTPLPCNFYKDFGSVELFRIEIGERNRVTAHGSVLQCQSLFSSRASVNLI